jgi:hypothetical protein
MKATPSNSLVIVAILRSPNHKGTKTQTIETEDAFLDSIK